LRKKSSKKRVGTNEFISPASPTEFIPSAFPPAISRFANYRLPNATSIKSPPIKPKRDFIIKDKTPSLPTSPRSPQAILPKRSLSPLPKKSPQSPPLKTPPPRSPPLKTPPKSPSPKSSPLKTPPKTPSPKSSPLKTPPKTPPKSPQSPPKSPKSPPKSPLKLPLESPRSPLPNFPQSSDSEEASEDDNVLDVKQEEVEENDEKKDDEEETEEEDTDEEEETEEENVNEEEQEQEKEKEEEEKEKEEQEEEEEKEEEDIEDIVTPMFGNVEDFVQEERSIPVAERTEPHKPKSKKIKKKRKKKKKLVKEAEIPIQTYKSAVPAYLGPALYVPEIPDYNAMTPLMQKEWREEFRIKFGILRRNFKEYDIPPLDENEPLEHIHARYDRYIRHIHISGAADSYRNYLLIYFIILEVIATQLLGLPANGYTMAQLNNMTNYERMMLELGEKWYQPEGEEWPVEYRLVFASLFNLLLFIIMRWLGKFVGDGVAQMIINTVIGNVGTSNSNPEETFQNPEEASNVGGGKGMDLGSLIGLVSSLLNNNNNGGGGGGENAGTNEPKRRKRRRKGPQFTK
jgi:chemotaxis protein histidine kinase CheA